MKQLHDMTDSEFKRYVEMHNRKRKKENTKYCIKSTDFKYINKKTNEIVDKNEVDLSDKNIVVVHRICALRNIGHKIKKGDLGGYVESDYNLDWDSPSWISDNAIVYGKAKVYGKALVKDNSMVYGTSEVYGSAVIKNNAIVCDKAKIMGKAIIADNSIVYDKASVFGEAMILGNSDISGKVCIYGNLVIKDMNITQGDYYLEEDLAYVK